MSVKELRIRPSSRVNLARYAPDDTSALSLSKKKAEKEIERLRTELAELQELLYADGRFAVLVVLQGMDTSGKDGTIRHVFQGVNPQGVRVASFKVPTPLELRHDFLWRVHRQAPAKGEIVIFNRSHYEDVLVARVHGLVPKKVWKARYAQINAFEHELVEQGVTVLKFFLHVSAKEQAQRLRERRDDPAKRWKFSEADVKERQYWPRYVAAYREALEKTSTAWAPWFVVPADHRWYRNVVVSTVLVRALRSLGLRYPEPTIDLGRLRIG